jgi:hypothetical protein
MEKAIAEISKVFKTTAKILTLLVPALAILQDDSERISVLCVIRHYLGYGIEGLTGFIDAPPLSVGEPVPLTDTKVHELIVKLDNAASFASASIPILEMTGLNETRTSLIKPLVRMLKDIRNDVFMPKPSVVPSDSPVVPSESSVVPPALPDANRVGRSYTGRAALPKPNHRVSFSIDLASLSVAERNVLAQEAMESEQFDSSQYY